MALSAASLKTEIRLGIKNLIGNNLKSVARDLQRIDTVGHAVARGGLRAVSMGSVLLRGALQGVSAQLARTRAAAMLAGAAMAYLAGRFVQSSIEEFAQRESAELGLQNLLRNAKVYRQVMAEIRQIAKLPAIDIAGALHGFQQLQSAGAPIRMSLDLVREFGNAVAMGGGGANEYKLAIRGLSQTFGKAQVMAEELNQQILEQAPMIRMAIKAAFPGQSLDQVLKQGLTGAQFWGKVLPFLKQLPRAGNGAKNAIENVGIAWTELKIAFGRGLMSGSGKGLFGGLEDWLTRMAPKAEEFGRAIARMQERVAAAMRPWVAMLQRAGQAFMLGFGPKTLLFALLAGWNRGLRAAGLTVRWVTINVQSFADWATRAGRAVREWLVGLAEQAPRALAWLQKVARAALDVGVFSRNQRGQGGFGALKEAERGPTAWDMIWRQLQPIVDRVKGWMWDVLKAAVSVLVQVAIAAIMALDTMLQPKLAQWRQQIKEFREELKGLFFGVLDKGLERAGALLTWLGNLGKWFGDIIQTALVGVNFYLKGVADKIRGMADDLERAVGSLMNLKDLLGGLKDFGVSAAGTAGGAADWVKRSQVGRGVSGAVGAVGDWLHQHKVPGFAAGGLVQVPTLALIGEGHGPEAVIPLNILWDQLKANFAAVVGDLGLTQVVEQRIGAVNVPPAQSAFHSPARPGSPLGVIEVALSLSERDRQLFTAREQGSLQASLDKTLNLWWAEVAAARAGG